MTTYVHGRPARTVRRRRRGAALGLLAALVVAPIAATVAGIAPWSPAATGSAQTPGTAPSDAPPSAPDGIPVTSTAVTELDPDLLARFQAAHDAAAADDVELVLRSGWRSADEQQQVVADTVARYGGDVDEAHRWVLPPDRSAHVAGRAIDVGFTAGAYWLTEHGPQFGLCRVYDNEPWHFEPLVEPGGTCPATLPDSSWGWR